MLANFCVHLVFGALFVLVTKGEVVHQPGSDIAFTVLCPVEVKNVLQGLVDAIGDELIADKGSKFGGLDETVS